MKHPAKAFIIVIFIFLSCKQQSKKTNSIQPPNKKDVVTQPAERTIIPFFDTTIALFANKRSVNSISKITEAQAESALYKYFKRKGILPRDKITIVKSNDYDKLCVTFDTVYQNKVRNRFTGIISYWLGPSDLNGHCFQPNKAIVYNTTGRIMISNEDFIPKNLTIDSVVNECIYGYDYDCGGKGMIRSYKATLK